VGSNIAMETLISCLELRKFKLGEYFSINQCRFCAHKLQVWG
jgi:hypothetical protein